ncbi:MAG TPA: ATP-dependent DNA helicase [Thermoanaerobaculia bacterium]|nr:ATP-dependent DNA helicase [Thermoanaerobaculia bacterium]
MALTVDLAAKTITLSPGTLLGGVARRIGFDRGDGFERLWIGQAVHRRVLGDHLASLPGYEVEKAIRLSYSVDDFTAVLEGRLDGRFEEGGRVVVDEVKSLHFAEDLAKLPGSPRLERFQLQLRWYMQAVAVAEGRPVHGRLVLADIETGATKLLEVPHDPGKTLEDLVHRTRMLLDAFLEERALAEAKAAEAATLAFPHARFRRGQREMASAVARAAAQGEHLLVEAPTGIGKTAAALHPLLVGALESHRRLFVLTAKTTQQEIYEKTLAAIDGESFRSVRLRAKERMCANDVVLCHENHCPYAKDYGAKMEASGLLDRLLERHRHLDPDTVFEAARNETVCPFEVSLELAEQADVVLGDYNYVFDPVVALAASRDPSALADSILLVDEAHNLVDRGRGYYSPELSDASLAALEERIGVANAKTAWDAGEAARRLRKLVADAAATLPPDESEAVDLVALDEARLDDLRLDFESLLVRHLADLRAGGERVPDDPVLDLYFSFARFHDVSKLVPSPGRAASEGAFDVLAARGRSGARLAILCKDPSRLLGETLNAAAATVSMSATLSPPEFYRDLLGLDPDRTSVLRLPSPFPRENRSVLVAPDVDTTYAARGRGAPRLAALVADVARACPGNMLALFPSYRFLDEVRSHLPPLTGRRVLRPSDRSTELERNSVLSAMKDRGAPVVLFAVSGGAFAEGVDYPGEMLQAVVVVSPALPMVRFEQERMRRYFEERFERGFEYAYVIPGMTRVVQSAGRLIRSSTDTGVVVLACRRFLQAPYSRHLPADWYLDDPGELACIEIGRATEQFFARVRTGELPVGTGDA